MEVKYHYGILRSIPLWYFLIVRRLAAGYKRKSPARGRAMERIMCEQKIEGQNKVDRLIDALESLSEKIDALLAGTGSIPPPPAPGDIDNTPIPKAYVPLPDGRSIPIRG